MILMLDEAPCPTALLAADHRLIEKLMRELASCNEPTRAEDLRARLVAELHAHLRRESQWLHPAARRLARADALAADRALDEVRRALAQVAATRSDDDAFADRLARLSARMDEHVRAEEDALFPRLRASRWARQWLAGLLAEGPASPRPGIPTRAVAPTIAPA